MTLDKKSKTIAQPKEAVKQKMGIKTKTDAKPKTDTKLKTDAKPKTDSKPKTDTKPKVKAKPKPKLAAKPNTAAKAPPPANSFVTNVATQYVVHVAPDFFEHWKKSASSLGMTTSKVLHENFLLCNFDPKQSSVESAALFLCRFIFPVHHMWPVKVSSEDFIERASQGILKAFSASYFQNIQIFSPMVGLQSLCKNLRGRILQLAEPTLVKSSKGQFSNWRQDPFKAPTNAGSLYICITSNCVYAGVSTPRFSGSYYAGGRRFLKTSNEDSISRASAKIVEAIEHLDLIGCNSSGLMSWLELGASPGGMTRELLSRDKNVVAVDRAHLSHELQNLPRLKFVQCDARQYSSHQTFDAILCDMNGDALTSAQTTSNLSKNLKSTGIIIFTLKIADAGELQYLLKHVLDSFENKNLKCFSIKHLFHNRQEVTLFFRK